MKVNVTVLMDGRETVIPAQTGETILEALARAGIAVSAPCGGLGRCRKCAVRATGEFACEDGARLDGQTVLACRTRFTGDARVRVSESKAEILKTGVSAGEETDGEAGLGVSVDVGTTTLAAYLVERSTGRVLASDARLNPQRPHGADVISRLSFAIESEENAALLQREILAAIDEMTRSMLERAGRAGEEIRCRALVGNTVMMHLLGGYPARPLAFAPFTPAYTALHEKELGGIRTILGGCISGYVGADTLAAALACGLALPAAAEHYTGADDWNVAFTGKGMESNFRSSVFDDAMTALQPGDSVTLTVHLQNTTADAITDWYMTNEVLRSLEESQTVARSGGYTYELTYTGPGGEQATLFSSEAIGGEKDQQAGLGLHEATDSLEDFFYLDQLLAGQSATVTLEVSLDGETQGNAYQDTLAQLQMNFAVELKDVADGGRFDSNYTDTVSSHGRRLGKNTRSGRRVYVTRIPQTGDESHPLVVALVCGISGLALLALGLAKLRKSKRDTPKKKEEPHT